MEERILYFDIVNGISGDMTIATLLDLGISKEVFLEEINKLNLGDEFNINIQEENEDGIVGTKVEVITKEVNAHRHLSDIYEIIDKSSLNEYVKENSPYHVIFCKIRKRDEKKFLDALSEMYDKMLLMGYKDYQEVCDNFIRVVEKNEKEK